MHIYARIKIFQLHALYDSILFPPHSELKWDNFKSIWDKILRTFKCLEKFHRNFRDDRRKMI